MHLFDVTLPTPAENLALDEALLDEAEAAPAPREALRLWESPQTVVVVGRSSRLADEVHEDYCLAHHIPVARRSSGGAAIVAGTGCLMYALVLSYDLRPELRMIDAAHRFVLGTICQGLRAQGVELAQRGTSDLALGEQKISGNSVRCKRSHFLYHGTLLYRFDLALLAKCLKQPPRQPEYRQQRSHASFVTNLPLAAAQIRAGLVAAWNAVPTAAAWPGQRVDRLVAERYGQAEWNEQR